MGRDHSGWIEVAVSVGSNIDPETNIEAARKLLKTSNPDNLRYVNSSPLTKTEPRGITDQPTFLNGAFLVETRLDAQALDRLLKGIEQDLGRQRTENRNGPRTIDLDIVVWDDKIVDEDFYTYDFVRSSVLEIIPELNAK